MSDLADRCMEWATQSFGANDDAGASAADNVVCPFVLGPAAAAAAMITYLQLAVVAAALAIWGCRRRGARYRPIN